MVYLKLKTKNLKLKTTHVTANLVARFAVW